MQQNNIDDLVQDYNNSIVNALDLLQPCIKPSIYTVIYVLPNLLVECLALRPFH